MILTTLAAVFVIGWLSMSFFMHRFAQNMFRKYRKFPLDLQATIDPKYKGILRQDFGKWD